MPQDSMKETEKKKKTPAAQREHVEEQLDDALANSSPASDPVSFVTSQTEEDWEEEKKAK